MDSDEETISADEMIASDDEATISGGDYIASDDEATISGGGYIASDDEMPDYEGNQSHREDELGLVIEYGDDDHLGQDHGAEDHLMGAIYDSGINNIINRDDQNLNVQNLDDQNLNEQNLNADLEGNPIPDNVNANRLNEEPIVSVNNQNNVQRRGRPNPNAIMPYNEAAVADHYIGPLNFVCPNCNAKFFRVEIKLPQNQLINGFNKCCNKGTINIRQLDDPPQLLQDLFSRDHEHSQIFFQNIRIINSAFSFTSIGAKLDAEVANMRAGGYCFKIHGQMYHLMGSLDPPDNSPTRKFAQILFYDTAEERIQRRRGIIPDEVPLSLIAELNDCFEQNNPLVRNFRQIGNQVRDNRDLTMVLRTEVNLDRRVYNAPTDNHHVAAIIPTLNAADTVDIVVNTRDNRMVRIYDTNVAVDAYGYALLFPRGELGWQPSMARQGVTLLDFTCYRLQIREGSFNTLLRAGKLTQQYAVHKFSDIEAQRLRYIKNNQRQLRAESYQGLVDSLLSDVNSNGQVGRIILPSTFYRGGRFYNEKYQDAMALVRHFGKPDLFITMTCNPNWREITENLFANETSWHRPELVCRVFYCKLEDLLEAIIKRRCFVRIVVAHIYSIEFQKRGLPHAHILINFEQSSKITTVEHVDSIICAELPDPVTQSILFQRVSVLMMHRPCLNNRTAACQVNGRCSKNFPKPYADRTVLSEDSYPKYRRRNNGRTVAVQNQQVGNEYVVPFNPYLIKKFNCHINVEVVSNIQVVKYLYKYVYKGYDRAVIEIASNGPVEDENGPNHPNNEIKRYLNGRYLSAPEAFCGIYSKPIHKEFPTVYKLAVHLENQQNITFNPEEQIQEVVNRNTDTTLTAWFKANIEFPQGRIYRYDEYPSHYTYDRSAKKWKQRRYNTNTVGRMYTVNPRNRELFYLRLLLNHVRGATSFADVRTVNGTIYPTNQAAAEALGILRNSTEFLNVMNQALDTLSTRLCRYLFADLMIYCEFPNPGEYWSNNRERFIDDLSRQYPTLEVDDLCNLALIEIENSLIRANQDLNAHGLPSTNRNLNFINLESIGLFADELNMNSAEDREEFRNSLDQLNQGQRDVYDRIRHSIDHQREENNQNVFFLKAPGGTGKSFLLNTLLSSVRTEGDVALAVASSGIAALVLRKGKTAHSRFKIPLDLNEFSTSNIPLQSPLADLIRRTKLIVWDEAVMMHRFGIECFERVVRPLLGNQRPFGGIPIVFAGDFRQILPVVPLGDRSDVFDACILNSLLWNNVEVLELTENVRIDRDDPNFQEFNQYLLNVGEGRNFIGQSNEVFIPAMLLSRATDIDAFIQETYTNIENESYENNNFRNTIILAARNDEVDEINENIMMNKFQPDVEARTYTGADEILDTVENNLVITNEYLNSLTPTGMPPYNLKLKVGAPVILLRNIDPERGLCNGTRMLIKMLFDNFILVTINSGSFAGTDAFIPRIVTTSRDARLPFSFERLQLPIKPCFGMTFNKSQGQTFDNVGIFLRNNVFSHGQLYVALSRARNSNNLKVYLDNAEKRSTVNVVYPEVFQN